MTNFTPASEWNTNEGSSGKQHPVEVPSGKRALCIRPGMDMFLRLGFVPNSLMGVVQRNIQKAEGRSNEDIAKELSALIEDPSKMDDMLRMVDQIVCFIVKQPTMKMPPPEGEEREDGVAYVDQVELTDKMYLFQWAVGGSESLERFRQQLAENVAVVHDNQAVLDTAKPTPGTGGRLPGGI